MASPQLDEALACFFYCCCFRYPLESGLHVKLIDQSDQTVTRCVKKCLAAGVARCRHRVAVTLYQIWHRVVFGAD